jgi:NADH-quinone oxidoreductase subunit C
VDYHLSSIPFQKQVTIKISKEHGRDIEHLPHFPSVSSVYRTADWHEREAFELIGIWFEGHPDLRKLLLPDDWEGYPLRKDYKTAEYYKGIKID